MASTYLSRTFGSNSVSNRKFTYSFWIKRSGLGECTMTSAYSSGTYFSGIKFLSDDRFELYDYRGSYILQKVTSKKFRDTNAWYHIVIASDTSVSTPNTKIYINGVQETTFDTNTDYNQNASTSFNHSYNNTIGAFGGSSYQQHVDGLMSHFHFCDGYTYQASDFGETDSTTGMWKIKATPSVSYGSNGFFILKDGNNLSGSTVQDQSGQGNNWTVGAGTLTSLKDCPDNVFATMNSLDNYYFSATFSNVNNTVLSDASVESYATSTLGASSGKYYWEIKVSASGSDKDFIGIADKVATTNSFSAYSGNNKMLSYYGNDGTSKVGSTGTSFGASYGAGDIIGVAMDLDNYKLYFSKNGTWQGSGNPSTGANGLTIDTSPASGFYYAQFANIHNTASTFQANFGNGYFGTTAVSSAQSPSDGTGIFEYAVPSGFKALCTKSINAQEYS